MLCPDQMITPLKDFLSGNSCQLTAGAKDQQETGLWTSGTTPLQGETADTKVSSVALQWY